MFIRLIILLSFFHSSLLVSDQRMVIHEGVEREYIIHVPENLNQDSPIVFVIHGYTGSAEGIAAYTGMNNIAEREGFIAVYPQGTIDSNGNTFFNVGYEFNDDSPINDVSFIRELVRSISQEFNLKRKKAFATGMSNGGDMSYLLACTSSDLFKAVAPVAGVLMKGLKDSCELSSPVPIFEIHGTADKISLFEGDLNNEGGWGAYYDLPSTIDFFAERYQLTNKSVKQMTSKESGADYDIFFERHWADDLEEEVWMYRIEDGRHVWPGIKLNWWDNPLAWFYFGSGNEDINASEEVWAFFKKYL
ncbi:prolyl oligopeptidase family serine peptidase [Gammaproteobacteria bacterium]|nr:prolyl oligopeptidase family serine peptidase [Gammaproteobacteria bacterium]